MRNSIVTVVTVLAAVALPWEAVVAAASGLRLQAAAVAGYDSNPLRVSDDGDGGAFTEVRLDVGGRVGLGEQAGLFVDFGGRQRWNDSGLSDADALVAELRAGAEWTPWRSASRYITLAGGGILGLQRLTFIDRATGEPYEVVEDPATTPPLTRSIAERLDLDRSGAFLDARWRVGKRVRLFVDSLYERNDYVEDYSGSNVLEPLDHDRLSLTPGIRVVLHGRARVTASYTHTDTDHDDRLARDISGDPVNGVLSEYRYSTWRLSLDLLPASKWETSFGINTTDRDDLHAGYYDYGGSSAFAWVKNALTDRTSWQVFTSWRELDYENATVSDAPGAEFRTSESLRVVARVEHGFTPAWLLFVEGGHQDSDSNDPDYAYGRDWALTGMRYRR